MTFSNSNMHNFFIIGRSSGAGVFSYFHQFQSSALCYINVVSSELCRENETLHISFMANFNQEGLFLSQEEIH